MVNGLEASLPAAALLFDRLIGDPRSPYHPVVLVGNCISIVEKALRRPDQSRLGQNMAGAILVIVVLAFTYGTVWLLDAVLASIHPWIAWLGQAVILSFAITPRSLAEAGNEIRQYLLAGDLAQARYKVGWIVGRDTAELDESEITRATVETVAENIVDGIISPLFYFAIGGAPLAFLYRAVNTLDSMLGYKNEKYLHFGMVAARVDDVFNYLPARLTGLMIVVCAFLMGRNAKGAAQMIVRDAAKHPSPNSGIAEAGVAGALGVRLGGVNYYGGVKSCRAYMGDANAALSAVHIGQTITVMYAVTLMWTVVITLWRLYQEPQL